MGKLQLKKRQAIQADQAWASEAAAPNVFMNNTGLFRPFQRLAAQRKLRQKFPLVPHLAHVGCHELLWVRKSALPVW